MELNRIKQLNYYCTNIFGARKEPTNWPTTKIHTGGHSSNKNNTTATANMLTENNL